MLRTSLFAILVVLSFVVCAQDNFTRSYGNEGDDGAFDIVLNEDGTSLIVGISNSYTSSKGALLNKVDTSGNVLWTKLISHDRNIVVQIAKTSVDGGYILAGNTNADGAGKKDALLIKTDSEGNVVWSKLYGGIYHDYVFDVIELSEGGYVFVGETNSFDSQASDIFITKTDANGDLLWSKAYGGEGVDFAYAVTETENGFVVASETESYGAGGYDVSLLNIDADGQIKWFNTYGGEKDDYGYDVVSDTANNIYMVGATQSFGMGEEDIYLFQINDTGAVLSARTLGDIHVEEGQSVKLLPDGGVAIAGFTNSYQNQLNAEDGFLLRLTPNLHLKWSKVFGGVKGDYFLGLEVSKDFEFYMVGETFNYNNRIDKDVFFVKMVDKVHATYCEQAKVQVLPLKITEDLVVAKNELSSREISPVLTSITFEVKEVEIKQNDICTDDVHNIDGKRLK